MARRSPEPSPPEPGQRLVSPDPTIAVKAALYTALRRRDMTVADLADRLGTGDWHQAARLIDPKRSTKLTTLIAALDALRCEVEIAINDVFVPDDEPWSRAMLQVAQQRTRSPVLLPVARQRPEAATALKIPPKAPPSPGPGKPQRKSTYAQQGRELRQAEPAAPSRRKSKVRSPD